MQFNYNFSKLRCKKLAWMVEDYIWKWHIVFTDHMQDRQPRIAPVRHWLSSSMSYGFHIKSRFPNGPNLTLFLNLQI